MRVRSRIRTLGRYSRGLWRKKSPPRGAPGFGISAAHDRPDSGWQTLVGHVLARDPELHVYYTWRGTTGKVYDLQKGVLNCAHGRHLQLTCADSGPGGDTHYRGPPSESVRRYTVLGSCAPRMQRVDTAGRGLTRRVTWRVLECARCADVGPWIKDSNGSHHLRTGVRMRPWARAAWIRGHLCGERRARRTRKRAPTGSEWGAAGVGRCLLSRCLRLCWLEPHKIQAPLGSGADLRGEASRGLP